MSLSVESPPNSKNYHPLMVEIESLPCLDQEKKVSGIHNSDRIQLQEKVSLHVISKEPKSPEKNIEKHQIDSGILHKNSMVNY